MSEMNETSGEKPPFGLHDENSVIALAFESPVNFSTAMQYLDVVHFKNHYNQGIFLLLKQHYQKYGDLPTRGHITDEIRHGKFGDEETDALLDVVERKLDYRDIKPTINILMDYVKYKAYTWSIASAEVTQYLMQKNYDQINILHDKARHVTDISDIGSNFFSEASLEALFKKDLDEKLTCGIPELDIYFHKGGPKRKEILAWVGATGMGKSIMLTNAGRWALEKNLKVLHISLENSEDVTRQRYMGVFTDEVIDDRYAHRETILQKLMKIKNTSNGQLQIVKWHGGTITANTIKTCISNLHRINGWKPDVIIVDYLELMLSNNPSDNSDSNYVRQQNIAVQLKELAESENALVITATQTNREGYNVGAKGGNGGGNGTYGVVGAGQVAESYGKLMPMDYAVSINQTPEEKEEQHYRFNIMKNRNGPSGSNINVGAKINYKTMRVKVDSFV